MSELMRLNSLSPADGAKHSTKRVGRGIGSGYGKTCGRGHKGQKSRSGGSVRPGFEGGQMPLQKRLPKYGFTSRVGRVSDQVRVGEIGKVEGDVVDLPALIAAGLVGHHILHVKIFLQGELTRPLTVKGIRVSKGARAAIEAAGGTIDEGIDSNSK